jgi:hypothetical protein
MNNDQGGGRRLGSFVALFVTSLAQAGPVSAVEVLTPGLELPRGTLPEPTPPPGAAPVAPLILTGCHMVLEVWIGPRGLPARTTVRLLMHSGPGKSWFFRNARDLRAGEIQRSTAPVEPCLTSSEFANAWTIYDAPAPARGELEPYTGSTRVRISYLTPSRTCVLFDHRLAPPRSPREDLGISFGFWFNHPADCRP